MKHTHILPAVLCLLLPLAAQAGDDHPTSIQAEIQQNLADARKEVRTELAKAKQELVTENLRIDNGLQFGKHKDSTAKAKLPRAEITPAGDFLIEGKVQPTDTEQRQLLLDYRGQVVQVALHGISIGQHAANAALDAVGGSWFSMLFNALSGRTERQVERLVKQEVEPAVRNLCQKLPDVMAAQQRLATSLPEFRPYATLEARDVQDCESDMRREFASL